MHGRIGIMPTRNVNLTKRFDDLIEKNVASGRYGNASEVVREGLRLLEKQEKEDSAKIEWLRDAAQEGIDDIERGDYITFETDAEMKSFFEQALVTAQKELEQEKRIRAKARKSA